MTCANCERLEELAATIAAQRDLHDELRFRAEAAILDVEKERDEQRERAERAERALVEVSAAVEALGWLCASAPRLVGALEELRRARSGEHGGGDATPPRAPGR